MNGPLVVNQFCVKNFLVKDVYVEKIKVTKIKVKKFKYQQKFSEEQWISQPKLKRLGCFVVGVGDKLIIVFIRNW